MDAAQGCSGCPPPPPPPPPDMQVLGESRWPRNDTRTKPTKLHLIAHYKLKQTNQRSSERHNQIQSLHTTLTMPRIKFKMTQHTKKYEHVTHS